MSAAALVAAALAGGTLCTWWLHARWPLPVRLAAGAALGIVLQGLGGLAGAYAHADSATSFALAASCLPLLGLGSRTLRRNVGAALASSWRQLGTRGAWTRTRRRDVAAWALGTVALLAVFDRAVYVERDGSVATGVAHNFGDLPFHLGVAAGFAWGANVPPEHPELAGVRLSYPYLVDFAAALWARAGLDLPRAFRMQHLLLAPALLVLLWHWGLALTGERGSARLVPLIVLAGGGLGFAWWLGDLRAAPGGLSELLAHLPRDYTIQPQGPLRWGNAVTTLLIPQRGFLLGLPLLLIVWALWAEALAIAPPGADADAQAPEGALDGPFTPRARALLASGCVAGLLPLVHGHSFALALALAAALAVLFPSRAWSGFFMPALVLGAPQALLLAAGSSMRAGSFVGWHIGWDRGAWNPLVFWFLNLGAFLPLLGVALALLPPRARRFHAPFALLFVVPNLLRLSPWIWDNIKFLFPWFVSAAPFVAQRLSRLFEGRRPQRLLGAALLSVLIGSGALDLWRVGSRQIALRVFDAEGVRFARLVAETTPPHARLMHWPTHDAPTLLSGRPAVLGYPGHIWSQGLDGGTRELDIARFYTGAARDGEPLRRYDVDFVVVGPLEIWRAGAATAALERFPIVTATGPYRLYDVRGITGDSARPTLRWNDGPNRQ